MTDEELITRLRSACFLAFDDGTNDYGTAPNAADRIEALVRERDEALNQLDSARHSVDVLEKRVAHFTSRAEWLEAALLELITCVEDGCFCSEMKMATAIEEARAALKGDDHD
jgi:chromosome segregation ATPase